jgi:glycosyltransferase involved in cell wall biosynthesis
MFYNPNITIALSGYNLKNMVCLAIDSLLKIYPAMKPQIVYFDDFSTDGTKEELRSRGIKVITWDNELLARYEDMVAKHPEWLLGQRLSVRVSYIIECIVRQTKTDYLLLNDGDVLFVNNTMLEEFAGLATNYDIIFSSDPLSQNKIFQNIVSSINRRYIRQVDETENFYLYWRMRHSHVFLNIKKLKEIGITSDRLDEETAMITQGGLIDTFSDFTNRVIESGELKLLELPTININNIIHYGGHASQEKGLINGIYWKKTEDGGYTVYAHVLRSNGGQPVKREFVTIDLNKEFEELRRYEYSEILHILCNGYVVKDIYSNKKRNIYKITFRKIELNGSLDALVS